jgi:hypothetical protein
VTVSALFTGKEGGMSVAIEVAAGIAALALIVGAMCAVGVGGVVRRRDEERRRRHSHLVTHPGDVVRIACAFPTGCWWFLTSGELPLPAHALALSVFDLLAEFVHTHT